MKQFKFVRVPALAAGILALVWGCGQPSPVGIGQTADPQLTKPVRQVIQAVSSGEAASYSLSVSRKIVDREGGVLNVRFPVARKFSGVALAGAKLAVGPGALGTAGEVYVLSMTASGGSGLADVNILFGPSGTTFSPAATLTIALYGKVSAEDINGASHIYGDGRVESISTEATDTGILTTVVMSVPGFSRYDLDDLDRTDDDNGYLDW